MMDKFSQQLNIEFQHGGSRGTPKKQPSTATAAGQPFSLVIMDLTVPGGMGGKDAVRKLRELAPDIKIVVSSGYSEDPIPNEYRAHGFDAAIAKPHRFEELYAILSGLRLQ